MRGSDTGRGGREKGGRREGVDWAMECGHDCTIGTGCGIWIDRIDSRKTKLYWIGLERNGMVAREGLVQYSLT